MLKGLRPGDAVRIGSLMTVEVILHICTPVLSGNNAIRLL